MEAGKGDAILISVDGKNILVDGGFKKTYTDKIRTELNKISDEGQRLDLVVLTHFDRDHISGLIALLMDDNYSHLIKEVWFNPCSELDINLGHTGTKINCKDSLNFESAVKNLKEKNPDLLVRNEIHSELEENIIKITDGLHLEIISPTREKLKSLEANIQQELQLLKKQNKASPSKSDIKIKFEELWLNQDHKDTSYSNGASIAFLLQHKDKKYLFLGDAHIDIVTHYIKKNHMPTKRRLDIDFIKLSHHGSKNNISIDFLESISCRNYLISTSGTPSKETVAKIIKQQDSTVSIFCNYSRSEKELKHLGDFKNHKINISTKRIYFG